FVPTAPRAAILLPCAMGVTQKYYAEFAQWLALQGFLTGTFDYRGMGMSAPASLRGFNVDVSGWAEIDCVAMIESLKTRLPNRQLFVVGHSLGAQLIGMIPNRNLIDGAVMVASGSGYWRETSAPTRRNSLLLWFVLVPLLTPVFDYFPGKSLRVVGNLPRGAMEQWRRWCLHPEYMVGVEGGKVREEFKTVSMPMMSLSFTDDEMMSAASTESLHRFYSGAIIDKLRLAPHDVGVSRIGHFGFFRKQFAQTLWPVVTQWLEKRL
ncbi:MAG TPA: alpha/beta fold hydrolase, partial [Steroidobacteraceae bacterium]|nr:alpha/beta fold hydrolase [Steroidobacteraceae bacterium]